MIARIKEAAKYAPLEQLAVSPQVNARFIVVRNCLMHVYSVVSLRVSYPMPLRSSQLICTQLITETTSPSKINGAR